MPRNDAAARQKISDALAGKRAGSVAQGYCFDENGYKTLTMRRDHPLSLVGGRLAEHRMVLYDNIGPGPHACYWVDRYHCGKTELHWGGRGGIHVDHLDNDRQNNDPDNLVPSCVGCNIRRGEQPIYRRARLTIDDVRAIRHSDQPLKEIAAQFGISISYASQVRSGQRPVNI